MNSLMERAHEILSSEPKAEIQHSGSGKGFASSYKLEITSVKKEMNLGPITTAGDEVAESIVSQLQEHFNRIQESKAEGNRGNRGEDQQRARGPLHPRGCTDSGGREAGQGKDRQ